MQGSQKKWPSRSQETAANSIAERNQHKLLVSVGSSSSNKMQLKLISWTPLVGRQQISCCSSLACWLFEPESNMSLLSVLGRITLWLLLWWPCSVTVCVREQLQRLWMCAFASNTWNVSLCVPPSLAAVEWVTRGGPTCAAAFCPLALYRSALHSSANSAKPQIIHSLGYESREEGEMEKGNARETRSSTHSGTHRLSAFCLVIVSEVTHSLLPHSSARESQRKVKIPTCALSPSLSLDPILVWLFPCSFSSSFFFSFQISLENWSGLAC